MDIVIQIWLFIFSAVAIWLVGRLESWKRWGYIIGLYSQPAWFYTASENEQWGIIALATWYSYCWIQGVHNYWIKPKS